jgi:PST family polysaccharide transporter
MLIPLLTLPILARALGVEVFGQVMLAQSLVLLGVVFVDAGFNTESQRRVAIAQSPLHTYQALLDNLLARTVCAVPVVVFLLSLAFFLPGLPVTFVLVSLFLIGGTLAFPQWWFVARQIGWRMGLAAVTGRLLSAGLILLWVHTTRDGAWAALAASLASLFSGILMFPLLYKGWREHRKQLNWHSWQTYLATVRMNVFSGFFASASSAIPVLVLGFWSGPVQTGFFSAADRLTRAAAYVLGFIEQSLMGFLANKASKDQAAVVHLRQRMLVSLLAVVALGCAVLGMLAPVVLNLLYGLDFASSVLLFRILLLWLLLYGTRKALVSFYWSSAGALGLASRLQWLEAILVLALCAIGAYMASALGVTIAMCVVESVLIIAFLIWQKRSASVQDF